MKSLSNGRETWSTKRTAASTLVSPGLTIDFPGHFPLTTWRQNGRPPLISFHVRISQGIVSQLQGRPQPADPWRDRCRPSAGAS